MNQAALLRALHGILGSQFREFVAAVPRRGDLVGASNTIAAAAGFPAGKDDRLFGSLPMTLALIAKWPSKVESDLNRFWGLDYCDRFRFDVNGNRLLTLRRIHTRLTNLPAESSLAIAMGKRTGAEILLMDVFKAIAGKDHPARPLTPEEAAQARSEQASISKAREEYRARRDREKNRRTGAAELARRNRAEQRQREGQINAEAS